jgi:hypothetical protein
MSSSSEDSLPLIRRQVVQDIMRKSSEKKRAGNKIADSSESDLPSWLDDDKLEQQTQQEADTLEIGRPSRRGKAQQGSKGTPMIYLLSSESEDELPLTQRDSREGAQTSRRKSGQSKLMHTQSDPLTQQDTQELGDGVNPDGTPKCTQGTQQSALKQACTGQGSIRKTKESPSGGVKGEKRSAIDVIIPEKLPGSKLVLELESHDDTIAGATDLSGDTGAIGRLLKRSVATGDGSSPKECYELDLKGRIYSVSPVEFPGTIMVLNFTGDEARVESLTDAFLQLREDTRFRSEEEELKLKQWLQDDDDDDDHLGGSGSVPRKPSGAGGGGNKGTKVLPKQGSRKEEREARE